MEQIQSRSRRRALGLALQALACGGILTATGMAVFTVVRTPKWETELVLDIETREAGGASHLNEWFLTVSSVETLRDAAESLTGGRWSDFSDAEKLRQLAKCVEMEGGHGFTICIRASDFDKEDSRLAAQAVANAAQSRLLNEAADGLLPPTVKILTTADAQIKRSQATDILIAGLAIAGLAGWSIGASLAGGDFIKKLIPVNRRRRILSLSMLLCAGIAFFLNSVPSAVPAIPFLVLALLVW